MSSVLGARGLLGLAKRGDDVEISRRMTMWDGIVTLVSTWGIRIGCR